jgi:hypothetical protein
MSLELRDSRLHGTGVFTTRSFPKHAVVCKVKTIRTITKEHPLDPEKGELYYHCHWHPDGEMVLLDEPYCYFNHSCQPNMFYYTINKSVYCLAIRDIAKDEELTLEYSLCNMGGKEWVCNCGLEGCRGHHRCGFLYMEHSRQMQLLPYLDPEIVEAFPEVIQGILEKELSDK